MLSVFEIVTRGLSYIQVSAPATTTIQRTDHTIIDSAYAKPFKVVKSEPSEKGKQLDCMLGNLHADMSKQGVNTTQKGCCCACNKPIVGEVIINISFY